MSKLRRPDCLEVINGPEDGARFPVFRLPFFIGSAQRCDVILRLDDDIKPTHAKLSKAFGGYCVRRCGRAAVYVDGKQSGWLRTRIVRPGGVIQVGNTLLRLASSQEDVSRTVVKSVTSNTRVASWTERLNWFSPLFHFARRHWILSVLGTFLLYYFGTRLLDLFFGYLGHFFHILALFS